MATLPGEAFAYFLWEDPETLQIPLPVQSTDRIALTRGPSGSETTYYAEAADVLISAPPVDYNVPLDGDTYTAAERLGFVVFDPVAPLSALDVVFPSSPGNGQVFGFSTTQTIVTVTPSAPGGAQVSGGTFQLTGEAAASWVYIDAQTKWFARGA